jgi:Permeases of the drug/metabolite transporter (DMT) superfamily
MKSKSVYVVFCLVCCVFGTTFLAIKIGVAAGSPPFLFAAARFISAGAILGAILLATRRASIRSLARLAPRAALLSLPYIVGNFGATFWAEQYLSSSAAAQIDAAGPIASALLSSIFLGKKLRPGHYLGLAIGFIGAWLVASGAASGAGSGSLGTIAAVAMVCGAISFQAASILYKRLFDDATDPFAVNALNMLFGGLGLLALAAATGERGMPASVEALGSLAYLIVVGSLVGHSANLWLVKKAGPLFASGWSYVSPIAATFVGAALLDERLSVANAAGIALTLAGVYLAGRAEVSGPRDLSPSRVSR